MKYFLLVFSLFSGLLAQTQLVGIDHTGVIDYPVNLLNFDGNDILLSSNYVSGVNQGTAIPDYCSVIYYFNAQHQITDSLILEHFMAWRLFEWQGSVFLFGSNLTHTAHWQLNLIELSSSLEAVSRLVLEDEEMSLAALTAYVDHEDNLVLMSYSTNGQQFQFRFDKVSPTFGLVASGVHDAPISSKPYYHILELENSPGHYIVNSSLGMNYLLEKDSLNSFVLAGTEPYYVGGFRESNPAILDANSYLTVSDAYTDNAPGLASINLFERTWNNETTHVTEVLSIGAEWRISGSEMLYVSDEEIYLPFVATYDWLQNVPSNDLGVMRINRQGEVNWSQLNGLANTNKYYDPDCFIRLKNGQFVVAGKMIAAGDQDENHLQTFVAFLNEQGVLLSLHEGSVQMQQVVSVIGHELRLNSQIPLPAQLTVFDYSGKPVFSQYFQSAASVCISALSVGVYVVQVTARNISYTQKVIIR